MRGLQEVIERDAVVGAWWGRYPLQEHPFSAVLTHLGDAARIVRPNLTYRCFRVLSPFSEHVTIVTLEGDDREGYCFSLGSSCRETRSASWMKALLEAKADPNPAQRRGSRQIRATDGGSLRDARATWTPHSFLGDQKVISA